MPKSELPSWPLDYAPATRTEAAPVTLPSPIWYGIRFGVGISVGVIIVVLALQFAGWLWRLAGLS